MRWEFQIMSFEYALSILNNHEIIIMACIKYRKILGMTYTTWIVLISEVSITKNRSDLLLVFKNA